MTNEAAVHKAVRAIITPMPIDKIIGQPTNATVNLLKQQVAKIAAAVKTTSWGGRHGHLALVLDDDEYRVVTGNATHTTTHLVAPPIVPMALANNTTLTLRACITADHTLEVMAEWSAFAIISRDCKSWVISDYQGIAKKSIENASTRKLPYQAFGLTYALFLWSGRHFF